MVCSTLVQCSLLLCLSWTILSSKMHLHMLPLLKTFCRTMKFFHRLKMKESKVILPLLNDRRLPGIMVARTQYRHVYANFQQGLMRSVAMQCGAVCVPNL